MKKAVLFIMFFMTMLILFACADQNKTYKNTAADNSQESNIKFEYFYRGFVTLKEGTVEEYPHETMVIETEEDWHDFMNKYVPGIPYNTTVEYSKECLIFTVLFPSRPTYSTGADIKTFSTKENKLETEYIKGSNGISNGIYAQNIDGVVHCFVNVVKVNKESVPENIKNIYHKKVE